MNMATVRKASAMKNMMLRRAFMNMHMTRLNTMLSGALTLILSAIWKAF